MTKPIHVLTPLAPGSNPIIGRDGTISLLAVRLFMDAIHGAAFPVVARLSAVGLPPATLHDDTRISRADFYRLCDAALERTRDAAFGLRCAEHFVLPSVRSLLANGLDFRVEESDRCAIIRFLTLGASLEVRRFLAELVVAALHRRIRTLQPDAWFEQVSFAFPAPPHVAEYQQMFDGQARFDQPFTGLVLLRRFMEGRAQPQRSESASFTARVRGALMQRPSPRKAGMNSIARALGLSERSLRRRLLAEGTTFAAITEQTLAEAAERSLLDQHRTLQDIALELGFSDKAAFHRAFKRWTGTTPNVFRQRKREIHRSCEASPQNMAFRT